MKDLHLGAPLVDVMPSPHGSLTNGWFIGWADNGHGMVYVESRYDDSRICTYRADQIEVSGSYFFEPVKKRTSTKISNLIYGKRESQTDEFELKTKLNTEYEIKRAPVEDWTTNFTPGETVWVTIRGKRLKVKVVKEFRNHVAFRYPVGTVDSRPASELSREHGDTNADRMARIADIAISWANDPKSSPEKSAAAVTAIRKVLE